MSLKKTAAPQRSDFAPQRGLFFILHPSSFIRFFSRFARGRALVGLAILAACPTGCEKAATGDRLIVISPHPETTLYEFQWAFQPWYRARTGRDLELVWLDQGGSTKMLRFLFNEFQRSPEGVKIDMVWGGGMDPYYDLVKRDLLEPSRLPEAVLSAIPRAYGGTPLYDEKFRWYGSTLTGFGIIYNKRVLKLQDLPTPQTWTDLSAPAFCTWAGSADPRQSGTAHMAFEILLQAYGWEKGWQVITCLAANVNAFTRLASDVPRDVSLGEIAAGFCIDNYANTQIALSGSDVLGYVMPEGLTVVNPDGIAILKGAPNVAAARLFLEFVMSEPGQRLLMTRAGRPGGPRQFTISRMSVMPALYDRMGDQRVVSANPFRLKPALSFDARKSALRWKLVNDLIGVLLIENQPPLRKAWLAVAAGSAERRPALTRELGRMPLSEEEGLAAAQGAWNDPVARNQRMVEWSEFARAKYQGLVREAERASGGAAGGPAQ